MRPFKSQKRETRADQATVRPLAQSRRRLQLLDLPAELVHIICKFLCYHCQFHSVNPHELDAAYKESKLALSGLSRTCRAARAIAQPFLAHAYCDGRHPRPIGMPDWQVDFFKMAAARPELARSVKYLDLWEFGGPQWEASGVPLVGPFRSANGVPTSLETLLRRHPSKFSAAVINSVVRLVPDIEFLSIRCTQRWPTVRDNCPYAHPLPKLKTLAFHGPTAREHLVRSFLPDVAANLEALYVLGPYDNWGGRCFSVPHLPSLRKLVINGPSPAQMKQMVSGCPELVDIEYYMLDDELCGDVAEVINAIMPARERLRRLHLVHVPTVRVRTQRNLPRHPYPFQDLLVENCRQYDHSPPYLVNVQASWQLRYFPKLEDFGVAYAMVYGWPSCDWMHNPLPSKGWLWNLLPRRLRKLRVWPGTSFHALEHVTVGALVDFNRWSHHWDHDKLIRAKKRLAKFQDRKGTGVRFDFQFDDYNLNVCRRWPLSPDPEKKAYEFVRF